MPVFDFYWENEAVKHITVSQPYARSGGDRPVDLGEVLRRALTDAATKLGGRMRAPDRVEIDTQAIAEYGGGRIYTDGGRG